ncbi:hypothetical protein [Bradyrhizobium betae]|nr:hypothetical protein [Bradyrhizobium betae]MCS3727701.1 hypothetical protein [Bradyrhizobium betae]
MASITSGANAAFEKFFMSPTGGKQAAPPFCQDNVGKKRKFL